MDNKGQFIKGDPRCHRGKTGGSFKAGFDPRRSKSKGLSLVDEMIQRTPRAIEVMDYILNAPFDDKSVSMALRFKAMELCFIRGFGKPETSTAMQLADLTPEQVNTMTLSELSTLMQQQTLPDAIQ